MLDLSIKRVVGAAEPQFIQQYPQEQRILCLPGPSNGLDPLWRQRTVIVVEVRIYDISALLLIKGKDRNLFVASIACDIKAHSGERGNDKMDALR